MHHPLNVFVTNPPVFDWTIFLLGGAAGSFLGAFIILGIERCWDEKIEKEKKEKEKIQITNAFETEIDYNLRVAQTIIESLTTVHHSVFNFARFNTVWMDEFSNKYIDYSDKNSLRLYSFLYGAKSLILQIQDIQSNQHLLSAAGRALTSFPNLAHSNNQAVLHNAEQLKSIFTTIKKLRNDNKMFKGDVEKFIKPTSKDELSDDGGSNPKDH